MRASQVLGVSLGILSFYLELQEFWSPSCLIICSIRMLLENAGIFFGVCIWISSERLIAKLRGKRVPEQTRFDNLLESLIVMIVLPKCYRIYFKE